VNTVGTVLVASQTIVEKKHQKKDKQNGPSDEAGAALRYSS